MKFRLSRQPQTKVKEFNFKIICPSLRDDPAFSLDPHCNPYSVTSHNSWLSPPLGHPVLKNKKRPNVVTTLHDTADSDSDFHLVQPPNSPVISSASNSSPQQPFSLKLPVLSSTPASVNQSSLMSERDYDSSLPPPLKKENKRRNVLSRHQSTQSPSTKSFFSSFGKERRRSDLSASGHITLRQTEDPAAVTPQILGRRGRVRDLDQIDELDETNPWGIPIHHDGPYEVAKVPANKRVGGHVPLGLANANGLHNMHLHQTYIPPQIPSGVSLNLSPGQILPHKFLVPSIQPIRPSDPYIPHIPPVLTPLHEPQYMATFPNVDLGNKDAPSPIKETTQHNDDLSFNIGMAMLEPEDDVPLPSPHVFLSQPDEQHLDPYNLINLQSEHRQSPSPPPYTEPEPSASQASQNASSAATSSSNKLVVTQPAGPFRNNSDPPIDIEHIGSRDAGHQLLSDTPSQEQHQLRSSSQSSHTSRNPAILTGSGSQQHYNEPDNRPPLNDPRVLPPDRNVTGSPAVSRDQRVEVAQGTESTTPTQTSLPFVHLHRDRLPLPSINHRNEPDVQSTRYSTSTYSSSQYQDGRRPPSHRYLPKHLVMPTPLNTGQALNAPASLHIGRVSQSQISSHVNVKQAHFQPSPFNQHSLQRSPLGNLVMAPVHQEDVPVSGGRKLRKRASMLDPTVTTVSFAPPIIGFHSSATNERGMTRSKTEKIPMAKRLLSKRKP